MYQNKIHLEWAHKIYGAIQQDGNIETNTTLRVNGVVYELCAQLLPDGKMIIKRLRPDYPQYPFEMTFDNSYVYAVIGACDLEQFYKLTQLLPYATK